MNLAQFKADLATAESTAAALVADGQHGQSPFAGPLRSALGRAAEMIAEHEKWLAANPVPTTPEAPQSQI